MRLPYRLSIDISPNFADAVAAFFMRLPPILTLPVVLGVLPWIRDGEYRDQFVALLTISSFFAVTSRLGADSYLLSELRNRETTDIKSRAEAVLWLNWCLATLLLLFGVPFFGKHYSLFPGIALSTYAVLVATHHSSKSMIDGRFFVAGIANPVLFAALALCFSICRFSAQASLALAATVVLVGSYNDLLNSFRKLSDDTSLALAKSLIPFSAISINRALTQWGTGVAVLSVSGPRDLSLYLLVSRIASLLSLPVSVLNPFLIREFSVCVKTDNQKRQRELSAAAILLCLAMQIVVILSFFAFGQRFFQLFAVDVATAENVFIILSAGQIVHGLCGPVGAVLTASGRQNFVSISTVLNTLTSFLIGYYLLIHWGLLYFAATVSFSLVAHNFVLISGVIYYSTRNKK